MDSMVRAGDQQVGSLVLMSDYLAPTPLWVGVGACLGHGYLERLGLPEPLAQQLLAWQELFDAHYRQEGGWDSPDAATIYEQDGHQLQAALQEALPDSVVQLDLWPITGQAPSV
ncbi:hypothetical protein ACFEMC_10690 [Kineococcus sp. DHX-1]|uniref:hypothetical protein n=1 Tax=Kineococcus sp. DHX-1 TaxID=3349638 RepID=UPI0036D33181